jgi:VanZ family protein
MRIHGLTWLAGIAFLAVVGIIILADRGALPGFITRLYAFPYGDKVGHFLLMGSVAFFANLALHARRIAVAKYPILLGSLCVAILVTLEEFSQLFFPARTFDLLDLTASLLGIIMLGRAALLLKK